MKPAKCHHPVFTRQTQVSHVLDLVPTNEFDSLFQQDPVVVFEDEFGKVEPHLHRVLNAVATADTIEAPIVARRTISAEPETTQMHVTVRQHLTPPSAVLIVDPVQTDLFTERSEAVIEPSEAVIEPSEHVMDPTEPFRPVTFPPPHKRRGRWSIGRDLFGQSRRSIVLGSFGAVLLGAMGALALL